MTLRWREPPFATGVLLAVLAASALFAILPGVVEFSRAWRLRDVTGTADDARTTQ